MNENYLIAWFPANQGQTLNKIHPTLGMRMQWKLYHIKFIEMQRSVLFLSTLCWHGFWQSCGPSVWKRTTVLALSSRCRSRYVCVHEAQSMLRMSNSFHHAQSSDDTNSNERQQKGMKWILLVEDDEALRNNIGEYLANEGGYFVTGVPDARSAILVCRGAIHNKKKVPAFSDFGNSKQAPNHPDCLVLDLHLSGSMNGLDLLKMVRSDPNIEFLPVVLLAERGRADDRLQGYDAGADAYLSKPFNLDELLALIDGLVKRDRFSSRRARSNDEVAKIGSAVIKSEELRREILEIKRMLMDLGFQKNITLNTVQYDDVNGGSIEHILLEIKDSIASGNVQAYSSDIKHDEDSNGGEFVALDSTR